MNGRFRANIDAFCRLIEDDHVWMRRQPFADNHFLLIAAGERFDRLFPAKGFHLQTRRVFVRQRPFAAVI
ncbi:hypothetical protein D3C85_1820690 [compost metagenome]